MTTEYFIGKRVSFESASCTIRYIGLVDGFENDWLGVEWDDPSRGKNNGTVGGVKYFECQSPSPTAASFVRLKRKPDPEQSLVEAVHQKYATEIMNQQSAAVAEKPIMISAGKIAEEVGFDKIRAQLAQLHELKIVLVDGLRISTSETTDKTIKNVCPKIVELDLSRNLFMDCREITRVCNELEDLKLLRLNGNRLTVKIEDLMVAPTAFEGLVELEMDETYLSWADICRVAKRSRSLKTLTASSNGLRSLVYNSGRGQNEPHKESKVSNFLATGFESMEYSLTSLTLEYNNFNSLRRLLPLTEFKALEKLHLKGNQISTIGRTINGFEVEPVVFGKNIRYVDLSSNAVETWDFVDNLATTFPGLTALRFSHNPLYDSIVQQGGTVAGVEDGYMLTLARLGHLKSLNFSSITPAERTNAEMFYLSRIGKEMAEVPEEKEHIITSQHKRFEELCNIYGAPTVVRTGTKTINPDFLEGRLIDFTFYLPSILITGPYGKTVETPEQIKSREIPKTVDIYRLKGIVATMFGLRTSNFYLIWETGEWDPVAGYEEEEDDNDYVDGEDEEVEAIDKHWAKGKENGKWSEREVTLRESTRQVGFYIDGMEAKVRIVILGSVSGEVRIV